MNSPSRPKSQRPLSVIVVKWDLRIHHLRMRRHQLTMPDDDVPATGGFRHTHRIGRGQCCAPVIGCAQFQYWLHVTPGCFEMWHKQSGTVCPSGWPRCRHHVPMTSHTDGQTVGGSMQTPNNISKWSRQYSCEQWKWLQLCYAKCQGNIPTSHRPSPVYKRCVLAQATEGDTWEKKIMFIQSERNASQNKSCLTMVNH